MDLISTLPREGFGNFVKAVSILPINDLKGVKSGRFGDKEQQLRCKLASCYRLVDLCGWTHGIFNHIMARLDSEGDSHYLINPHGLLYGELTATSLLKVDINGNILDRGSSQFGINRVGFSLHAAIHRARPDVSCIIHLHTPASVAVSAMKCGLLQLGQESIAVGSVSYHDYHTSYVSDAAKKSLVEDLGATNKVMILKNNGFLACGETIEETFYLAYNMVAACEAQIRAVAVGIDNIVRPSPELLQKMASSGQDMVNREWRTGEIEFESFMRVLDNLGFRTGYNYKILPMVKSGIFEP